MKQLAFLFCSVLILASCNSKLKEQNAELKNKMDSVAIVANMNMNIYMEKEQLSDKMAAQMQRRADSLQQLLNECRAGKK